MSSHRDAYRDDSGVSLVLALVFITVVGMFAGAALSKGTNVSASGVSLRDRGALQYTLDGGVERALSLLVEEVRSGSPVACPSAGDTATLTPFGLNGQTASLTCTTTAGRASRSSDETATDYALIVTDQAANALSSSSGVGTSLGIAGSVYLNGAVSNSSVKKPLEITSGDLVSPASRPTCAADLTSLTAVILSGTGQLKSCTEQTLAEALPTVVLPTAPTVDLSAVLGIGILHTNAGKKCRVFYPGLYTAPPTITSDNYFVSGLYYFRNSGQFQIDGGNKVTGGRRSVSTDSPGPGGDCSAMTDATAMGLPGAAAFAATITAHAFSYGTTWVFGGTASLDFKNGDVTLFTPPAGGSTFPVNLVGASSSTGGYTPKTVGSALLTGGSNNTSLVANAKLYAPTTTATIFSTNNTVAAVRGGAVAYRIDLQASVAGSGGLAISTPGGIGAPPPPFRTVKVVTADSTGSLPATNTAVATISNFSPHTVRVLSWRTG